MKPRINWFLITLIFSLNSFLTQTSWSPTKSGSNATQLVARRANCNTYKKTRGETRSISHRLHPRGQLDVPGCEEGVDFLFT